MKKTITLLALGLFGFNAFAGTTATLLIRGNVPQILNIQITPEALASALPLDSTQNNSKVATVQERSNSQTGYKVSISSANQGKLIRSGGTQQFSYTLSYNGQPLNLASTVQLVNAGANAVSVNKNLNISYTGVSAESMVAGDYVDTLTFTIAAN